MEADVQQIFVVFFMTFSMATMALIHSAVVERIKAAPLLTLAVIVGVITSPLAGYLAWGPVSPLTNRGVHDYDGLYPLYIFAGATSLDSPGRSDHGAASAWVASPPRRSVRRRTWR